VEGVYWEVDARFKLFGRLIRGTVFSDNIGKCYS